LETGPSSDFAFIVRALRYRNYRLFFTGQLISLIGTWMTSIATSWLVYRLTGSALMLGAVGFAGQLPAFLFGPAAGLTIDRWDRRRILLATQVLAMLQSLSLAALTLSHTITMTSLMMLTAVDGVINAFDMSCRQAFVVDLIEDKKDLGNAIALNSSMVNAARLIGPSIGGLLIAAAGEGWCFFLDGVSFLAPIVALAMIRVRSASPRPASRLGAVGQLKEGFEYSFRSVPIRSIMILLAVSSLVGVPYSVLVPVFAARILHGGPHTLGFLMAAAGTGALAGAVWLAARSSVLGLGRAIAAASALFGLALAAFSRSTSVPLSLILLVVVGFGFMVQLASSNTVLQTIVDDDKRGRVMSLYMMSFLGSAPIGSLIAGAMADRIGAPNTVLLGGLSCLAGAAWFASRLPDIREAVRPIYRRMGILPQVGSALETAAELEVPPEE
jgi:MFS family permease